MNDVSPLRLVREALDEFESVVLAASARRALRIASLRGDAAEAWLLRCDLRPVGGSAALSWSEFALLYPDLDHENRSAQFIALREAWLQERAPSNVDPVLKPHLNDDGSGTMISGSIEEIARRVESLEAQAAREGDVQGRYLFEQSAAMNREILVRSRYRIFAYLTRCEAQLGYESVNVAIFERHRAVVDGYLRVIAPEVFEMLNAAYRRVREGDSESLSQALGSCRRILKATADVVFPARNEPVVGVDGLPHDLGPESYKNRLYQFLAENAAHRSTERLCHASLEEIDARVSRLNDLASKGVHDEVTAQEVDLCVIQAYLLAGEVLMIHGSATSESPQAL